MRWPRPHRIDDRKAAEASARTQRTRSPHLPRGGSTASRSRASSASRNSGACRCASTRPRWCPGRRPKPWSRQRLPRSTGAGRAIARSASLISAPARARCCSPCSASCRTRPVSAPTSAAQALVAARDNAACLGRCLARGTSRRRFRRGARRHLRPRGQQPALYRERRHRPARPRGPARSPPRARRRRRRPRLLSHHCGTGARSCSGPDGHLVVELGIGQEPAVAALFRAAGLVPAPRAPRPCRASRVRCMRMLPQ